MISPQLSRQIRRLQIRARRAVEDLLGGAYHSVFKGTGMAFEEVREYQPGDDVRRIDWNVTARMGHPFIKRYIEERELTVMLALDVSGSQQFGTQRQPKREIAAEIAALLAFSAYGNNDKVGLLAFSDHVELYLPPRKSTQHILRIIREVLGYPPGQRRTHLAQALDYLNRVQRRRAIVFLISDFLDHDYERPLRRAARRHDLIAVHISDPREEELPPVGLLEVVDAETGRHWLLDTSAAAVRQAYADQAQQRRASLRQLLRSARIDLIDTSTEGGHLDALMRFFETRQGRLKRE
ncbi:MAG: DUF58 domain-containing protein [Gemmataceae bacterium]